MEPYITFETAKLAKEKHYINDEKLLGLLGSLGYTNCSLSYNEKGELWKRKFYNPENSHYLAPTQSELQKWLREVHKIHIHIVPTIHGYWTYKIVDIQMDPSKKVVRPPQNILWHKEGDAFTHTCMVTKCMLKHIENSNEVLFQDMDYRNILIFAALLHDIGKPVTTKKGEDGLYHCKDHAIKGVPIAEHILDVYVSDIKPQYKRAILSLVRCHMQPLYILKQRDIK